VLVDLSLGQAGDWGEQTGAYLSRAYRCLSVKILAQRHMCLSAAWAACFSMLQDVENCLVTSRSQTPGPLRKRPVRMKAERPWRSQANWALHHEQGPRPPKSRRSNDSGMHYPGHDLERWTRILAGYQD
jgi:hypothetical protein